MNYQIGNKIYCTVPTMDECIGEGYTICTDLILQNCTDCPGLVINNGLLLCDCSDSWNCHLCSTDLPYWNTVNANDILYFQFQQPDPINGNDPLVPGTINWTMSPNLNFKIFECCSDLELSVDNEVIQDAVVGLFSETDYKGNVTYNNLQQISFNVEQIISQGFGNFDEAHCFYFTFQLFDKEFCSEPFKLNYCNKQSVLLEGYYPPSVRDCFDYYYGESFEWNVGQAFTYRNLYRVRGSFELQSIEIEKEVVTRHLQAVSSSTCEVNLLRTIGLPERVTKLIGGILASKEIYIDGLIYQVEGNIDKNNDTGSQFYLETQFKRCDCFPDFSCT